MDKLKSFDKRFFLRVGSALLAFTAMISAFSAIAKKDWGLALGLGIVGFLGLAENLVVAFLRKRGIGSSNNRLHAALDITVTVLWAILPFGLVIFWQSQLKNGKADKANEGSVLRLISMGFGMACFASQFCHALSSWALRPSSGDPA